jgi:hypothetical protein
MILPEEFLSFLTRRRNIHAYAGKRQGGKKGEKSRVVAPHHHRLNLLEQ